MASKKIPLLFSDVSYGTHEHGFIPRRAFRDDDEGEDEDRAYQKHLEEKGVRARVAEGTVYVDE